MAKVLVSFLSSTKVQAECSEADTAIVREKLKKEIADDESAGIAEADLEGICAIKRWLFSGTPCQVELDTENDSCRVKTVPAGVVAENKWLPWIEAFTIFAKYSFDGDVCAEHDEVWAGKDLKEIDPVDLERLAELGWLKHSAGGFRKGV